MICRWCQAAFDGPPGSLYCSTRHRVAAWRERRRYEDLAGVTPPRRNALDVTPTSETRVAALYVRADGPYAAMGDVDVWDAERDATKWWGPGPAVLHPDCAPWGRYRIWGSTKRADLAVRAVDQVRRWGGVLEHPAESHLWVARELPRPGEPPDRWGGWSYFIRQSWWGHRAPKPTWLYIVGRPVGDLPPLPPPVPDPGGRVENMCTRERETTPPALAAWLVELARACNGDRARNASCRRAAVVAA